MELVAITVSTNYVDFLELCINQNHFFFTHWFIVTDVNDFCTKELCSKYSNITVLDFNFFEKPSTCNCPNPTRFQRQHSNPNFKYFNKGGGIKKAQEIAYRLYPDAVYLVIDSDICLPLFFSLCLDNIKIQINDLPTKNSFKTNLEKFCRLRRSSLPASSQSFSTNDFFWTTFNFFKSSLPKEPLVVSPTLKVNFFHKKTPVIYGAPRILYDTIDDFINNKVSSCVEVRTHRILLNCLGYFQLYREKLYYNDSCTAAFCDTEFQRMFLPKQLPLGVVHHVGPIGQNWKGRKR